MTVFQRRWRYAPLCLQNKVPATYRSGGHLLVVIEKQNSKGRADIIIEGDTDIYIFEFKLDGSADEALKQIEDCQYALPYLTDGRKIHKIGVNISSETRTVAEWKVIA